MYLLGVYSTARVLAVRQLICGKRGRGLGTCRAEGAKYSLPIAIGPLYEALDEAPDEAEKRLTGSGSYHVILSGNCSLSSSQPPDFCLITSSSFWPHLGLLISTSSQPHLLLFYKVFGGHMSFTGGHWYPCFGFLVTSPLGFCLIRFLRRRM